jgi:hypothetical protein
MSDTRQPRTPTELGHLHPNHVRVGHTGVFAGDWSYLPDADGQMRIPIGFLGVLIDVWNGWAVFHCTRDVAEEIVSEQRRTRDVERAHLMAQGLAGKMLTAALDEITADMYWDGDDVVTDNPGRYGESDTPRRSRPRRTRPLRDQRLGLDLDRRRPGRLRPHRRHTTTGRRARDVRTVAAHRRPRAACQARGHRRAHRQRDGVPGQPQP